MYCPKDNTEMKQITKDDVVIDFCPTCRGVFLDRGELDKIIERSMSEYLVSESYKGNEVDFKDKPHSHHTGDPNYLAALFDMNTGSVNDRTSYMKNDDIK